MTDADSSEESETDAAVETAGEDGRDDERRTADRSEAIDRSLGVGVVTISTARSLDTDAAGEAIVSALENVDHEVTTREHIGSDHDRVQATVSRMIDRDDVDVVVTGGATSVEPDDVTIEAVDPLLEKTLSTFEDLFTTLAYEAVGTRAVAARTTAGVTEGTVVFCLPGDEDAARLGVEELVLPEMGYLVALTREEIDEDRWAVEETESDAGGE